MKKGEQKNNSVLIIVAVIGVVGTIVASTIGVIGNLNVEKIRQETELTRIALAAMNTQSTTTLETPISMTAAPTQNETAIMADKFSGLWVNSDSKAGTPQIHIFPQQGKQKIFVRAWGRCEPTWCDWGSVTATIIDKTTLNAFWDLGYVELDVTLHLTNTDTLEFQNHYHYKDNSGRKDFDTFYTYYKTSLPTVTPPP
jgi:hypothetical protein